MTTTPRWGSDLARTLIASAVAFPASLAAVFLQIRAWGSEEYAGLYIEVGLPTIMLTYWSVTTVLYCLLTHVHLTRLDAAELRDRLAWEHDRRGNTRWSWLLGTGGPATWTLTGGFIVLAFTLVLAQSPAWRSSVWLLVLSAVSVASSWVVMAYTHALRYGERDSHEPALRFETDETPVFVDYLQHSLLVSVAAISAAATPLTRAGWRDLTQHAVTAFVVNTVLVAMVVSLLLGRVAA